MTDDRDRDDRNIANLVPDTVRKLFVAGLGAVFLTEEGIRKVVGNLELPKELVSAVLDQADRSKRQLFDRIARELTDLIKSTDIADELRRGLRGTTIVLKTEISFREGPEDEADAEPKLESHVHLAPRGKK